MDDHFIWQDDYFAVSVSQSNLEKVINYIKNQEIHHRKKSFEDAVKQFIEKYGFVLVKDEL